MAAHSARAKTDSRWQGCWASVTAVAVRCCWECLVEKHLARYCISLRLGTQVAVLPDTATRLKAASYPIWPAAGRKLRWLELSGHNRWFGADQYDGNKKGPQSCAFYRSPARQPLAQSSLGRSIASPAIPIQKRCVDGEGSSRPVQYGLTASKPYTLAVPAPASSACKITTISKSAGVAEANYAGQYK